MDTYKRGFQDGLIAAIACLQDYSAEARADKKHQAANYLSAAATKVSRLHAIREAHWREDLKPEK